MGTIGQNLQALVSARNAIKTAINNAGGNVGNSMSTYADAIKNLATDWLCFTCINSEGGSVGFTRAASGITGTLYWTKDRRTWSVYSSPISLSYNERVWMKGTFDTMATSDTNYSNFSMTGKIAASGSVMELLSTANKNTIPNPWCFRGLFQGCTGLTTSPKLPATALRGYCYKSMFSGCTSLTTPPELPTMTVVTNCYNGMFSGCSSLVIAPNLPATTLGPNCYQEMFADCSNLIYGPERLGTTVASYCCQFMFLRCTKLTNAPELPATTLESGCYYGLFWGCSSLVNAPSLPATTLVSNCYNQTFNGCNKLKYIEALFTTTPGDTYTKNWVSWVNSPGTFVKSANATWDVTGDNGVPTNWTVVRNLPTSKSDSATIVPLTYPINYDTYIVYNGFMGSCWAAGQTVGRLKYNDVWHNILVDSIGSSTSLTIDGLDGCTISVITSPSTYGCHLFDFSMASGYSLSNVRSVSFTT